MRRVVGAILCVAALACSQNRIDAFADERTQPSLGGKNAASLVPNDGTPLQVQGDAPLLADASQPHLAERHRLGIQAMLFLGIFAGILYAIKRRIWRGAD